MVQRDLMTARKALKLSLKELDSAEGDRARLQKQVNKLSRTLQVTAQHCTPAGYTLSGSSHVHNTSGNKATMIVPLTLLQEV